MLVVVGSTNPVKIAAVKTAFKKVWPKKKFTFRGIKVDSGVSHQPMSDIEAIKGARNRAKLAISRLKADFGVGLEGGLHKIGKNWFDSGWIVVLDKKGNEGIGSSIRMETPSKMVVLMIKNNFELGEVDDLMFNRKNSKQAEGHFGLMTGNKIIRAKAYEHAVISALSRFINPDIFG